MSDTNNKTSGIGFLGLLTIVFITLKLLEKIDWSWWWVLSPILIPTAIWGVVILGLGVFYLWVRIFKRKQMEELNQKLNKPKPKSKWELRLEECKHNRLKESK